MKYTGTSEYNMKKNQMTSAMIAMKTDSSKRLISFFLGIDHLEPILTNLEDFTLTNILIPISKME